MGNKTIIISIHPQHIEKILSGKKLYEYRKRIPLDVKYLVVYATAPVKMIVALIEVDTIIQGKPIDVWNKTRNGAGITKVFYMKYFKQRDRAYAIRFRRVYDLPAPQMISCVKGVMRPPQSYMYICESFVDLCENLNVHNM